MAINDDGHDFFVAGYQTKDHLEQAGEAITMAEEPYRAMSERRTALSEALAHLNSALDKLGWCYLVARLPEGGSSILEDVAEIHRRHCLVASEVEAEDE